jgi:hypothetical protein
MIFSEELARWNTDPAAQRATRIAIDGFRADWAHGPVHRSFAAAMADLPSRTAAAIVAAIRVQFRDDRWIDALVGPIADAMRRDPCFLPPFPALKSDVHTGLLVYEDDLVQIAVGVSQAHRLAAKKSGGSGGSVNLSGKVTVLKFVRAGGATLSFWEAPRLGEDFHAGQAGTCRRTATRRIGDGETLVVDGRSQSYVIEHAEANLLVLQAVIKADQAAVSAEYDAATGAWLGCGATEDTDSRIQMIATLLRKLGHADAFAAILPFLDHPRFFVRWHVMRELIGIDARLALPHLAAMATGDPHVDVRQAARATLDQLERAMAPRQAA